MKPEYLQKNISTLLAALLLFTLLGGPQMVQAQNPPPVTEQSGTTQPPQPLPDAPSAIAQDEVPQARQAVGTPALPQDAQAQEKKDETPLGAAAAQTGPTAGGAASKPAGTALAPAKQRQVRSFLLKLGAIAAGGAALGAVLALSRSTPSVPPGSGR